MPDNNKTNTYVFATFTDYKNGKLTGAHRRYLELINGWGKKAKIFLFSDDIPQLNVKEIAHFPIKKKGIVKLLPNHIAALIVLCHTLRKYKRKIKYDYAIAFGPVNAVCYFYAGYRPIISLFRENLIGYRKCVGVKGIKLLYYKWLERFAVKVSDKVIVQCRNDKKQLIDRTAKYCKNVEEKIYIQINNINASWMKANICSHQKEHKEINILFIGHFSNIRKGHTILLPAVTKLLDEGNNLILWVAGDGSALHQYQEMYKQYDRIRFLGRVNDMQHYFEKSDFLIVPSLIDSCPNTVLEGLNAGIAVYGANTGGIPDLLQDGAYMFEPNEKAVYTFLSEIIQNRRYEKDKAAQQKLRKNLEFDWSGQIEKIITGN